MIEERIERIEKALAKLVANDVPHLKTCMAKLSERTSLNTKLILLMLTSLYGAAIAILIATLLRGS